MHQTFYKLVQNIDMWHEHRDSWLLETLKELRHDLRMCKILHHAITIHK